jgi:hypothetical protein
MIRTQMTAMPTRSRIWLRVNFKRASRLVEEEGEVSGREPGTGEADSSTEAGDVSGKENGDDETDSFAEAGRGAEAGMANGDTKGLTVCAGGTTAGPG